MDRLIDKIRSKYGSENRYKISIKDLSKAPEKLMRLKKKNKVIVNCTLTKNDLFKTKCKDIIKLNGNIIRLSEISGEYNKYEDEIIIVTDTDSVELIQKIVKYVYSETGCNNIYNVSVNINDLILDNDICEISVEHGKLNSMRVDRETPVSVLADIKNYPLPNFDMAIATYKGTIIKNVVNSDSLANKWDKLRSRTLNTNSEGVTDAVMEITNIEKYGIFNLVVIKDDKVADLFESETDAISDSESDPVSREISDDEASKEEANSTATNSD